MIREANEGDLKELLQLIDIYFYRLHFQEKCSK